MFTRDKESLETYMSKLELFFYKTGFCGARNVQVAGPTICARLLILSWIMTF